MSIINKYTTNIIDIPSPNLLGPTNKIFSATQLQINVTDHHPS